MYLHRHRPEGWDWTHSPVPHLKADDVDTFIGAYGINAEEVYIVASGLLISMALMITR